MHLNNYLIKDKKVVVATHNKGKVEEFKILFSKYDIQIMTSDDLNIGDVEETGKTFEENSIIKEVAKSSFVTWLNGYCF